MAGLDTVCRLISLKQLAECLVRIRYAQELDELCIPAIA
jgi:hypothetical protein